MVVKELQDNPERTHHREDGAYLLRQHVTEGEYAVRYVQHCGDCCERKKIQHRAWQFLQ